MVDLSHLCFGRLVAVLEVFYSKWTKTWAHFLGRCSFIEGFHLVKFKHYEDVTKVCFSVERVDEKGLQIIVKAFPNFVKLLYSVSNTNGGYLFRFGSDVVRMTVSQGQT